MNISPTQIVVGRAALERECGQAREAGDIPRLQQALDRLTRLSIVVFGRRLDASKTKA